MMECDTDHSATVEALDSFPKKSWFRSVEIESVSGDCIQSESMIETLDPNLCNQPVTSVDPASTEVAVAPELEEFMPVAPADSKPHVGREFSSEEDAVEFYHAYAMMCGFNIRLNQTKKSGKSKIVVFRALSCSKEGRREKKFLENTDRKRAPKPITRIGCPARLEVKRKSENRWVVTKFIEKHCHNLMSPGHISERPKFMRRNELSRLSKRFLNAALKSEQMGAFAMERIVKLTEELEEMVRKDNASTAHNGAGHNGTGHDGMPAKQVNTSIEHGPVFLQPIYIYGGSELMLPSTDFIFHDPNIMQSKVQYTNKRFKGGREFDVNGLIGADMGYGRDEDAPN